MSNNSNDIEWKVGEVKFFDNNRGFGFVKCWDDEKDYFVHISKVDTKPINDYDYVIFKLVPSRKKPGTYEAKNVSLVSQFSHDTPYLKKQFSKYPDEYFRKNVVQSLSINDVIDLLEKEIKSFESINTEEQFTNFNKVISIYTSFETNEVLHNNIIVTISAWIEQVASSEYKIKFWLNGVLNNQPEYEILEHYFGTSDNKDRLKIFKKIDFSSKTKLIQLYLEEEEIKEVLAFIVEHLKQVNELYYTDVKSKLFVKEFWADKTDYQLFETTIHNLEEILNNKEKASLFVIGYLNTISFDSVLETCLSLSRREIEYILNSEVLSKTEAFKIIDKILVNEIEQLECKKNNESLTKVFKWILELSGYLTENKRTLIESKIVDKVAEFVQIELWESDYVREIPIGSISNYLQNTEEPLMGIKKWLSSNKISKDDISNILKSNIRRQEQIKNRKEYYVLSNHLQALAHLDLDVNEIEGIIPEYNLWFYKLALWLEGTGTDFNYEEYKTKLVFLSPDHQVLFLKKLFWLAHTNKFKLTVEKLTQLTRIDFDIYQLNHKHNPEIPLNISVDIVIEAIKSFSENQKFLLDSDLLTIVLKDLSFDKKHKFKIKGLFEECVGRYEAVFDWSRNGEIKKESFGRNKFYFAIQIQNNPRVHVYANSRSGDYKRFVPNENFEFLKEAVKQLPGRKWNPNKMHWGVPSRYEEQVLQFARENRFFLNFEGSDYYANNTHLAELKRTEVPNGITYCEGRLAKTKHQSFNRPFWWCANQPCFSNCENLHEPENWNEYTLLDFLTILGLNLDDGNRVGDFIERGNIISLYLLSIDSINYWIDFTVKNVVIFYILLRIHISHTIELSDSVARIQHVPNYIKKSIFIIVSIVNVKI